MRTSWKNFVLLALGLWTTAPILRGQGQEPGYIETFSLAKDRAAALAQLIPGTEDYYYYNCLHALNLGQFEKIESFTRPWLERFGQTQRLHEIQTRTALLAFEKDPKKTFEYLKNRTGLTFNHQKEIVGVAPNLPTSLDQKLFSREVLLAESLRRWPNLDNFEDAALDWVAKENLDWEKRRNLLQRIQRPDTPNIVEHLVNDDQSPHPQAFGAYNVSRLLTLAQLEDLVAKKPAWINHPAMLQAWLPKLQPGADSDWKRNPGQIVAYLDRMKAFTDRLAPVNNALKANVLYHRLDHDRKQGTLNKARFLEYLALPRQQPYMAKALNEAENSIRFPAYLGINFESVTLMPPVHTDEELVRAYLKHFLVDAESTREFEPFILQDYLNNVLAEVKVENGLGDAERWASLLPPEAFKALRERIDIDFAPTNKTEFAVDEPVVLDLFVKNVPSLMVKVFEVNTGNFYRTNLREIDTDINLDGLVANEEKTHSYDESPLRRMARKFEFKLDKPGVYVIDFIGGGKSSRALIRKGRLQSLVTTTPGGQAVTVLDEKNRKASDATVWLSGKEYKPDEKGIVLLPFSNEPGRRQIVLTRGGASSLDTITHQGEDYQFTAGLHVDREALLSQRMATLLVRPGLRLAGSPVSLKLLEDVRLRITSVDTQGINTTSEVPGFTLLEDRETTHDFRVPEGTSRLVFTLEARIKNLSRGRTDTVSAQNAIDLNNILKTEKIEDIHLVRSSEGVILEVLGRTGEPRPDRAVNVSLKHRDFREMINVSLKSDAKGRVNLGKLEGIVRVDATGSEGVPHSWPIHVDRASSRQIIHSVAGEPIQLPYSGTLAQADRSEFSLFEIVGNLPKADRFGAIRVVNGLVRIEGLEPGDYQLWVKPANEPVSIRVVKGDVIANHVLGETRNLRVLPLKPVAVGEMRVEGNDLVIRVENPSALSRIHLFGTRYQPGLSAFAQMDKVRAPELDGVLPGRSPSVFVTGRNIGDEYRYVLDRRGQKKYPGVMAERPTLLLNPWAVRDTSTGEQIATGGEAFGAKGQVAPPRPASSVADRPAEGGQGAINASAFADLDFLANASTVVANLIPDKEGILRLPLKDLGDHQMIHAVACDPFQTATRSLTLPITDARLLDQRLRKGLDPAGKFLREKKVSVLARGETFTVDDIRSSKFEIYDSLSKVQTLFHTLNKDQALVEFSFLSHWHRLKSEEKRTLLSKHGCHELHFFIHQKDRAFFDEVVRPFLANKKDKTFVDRWLLDEDLTVFLKPWEYARLNTMERVLLAKRLKDEAKTGRHIEERLKLTPVEIQKQIALFDTAVSSAGLGDGGRQIDELRRNVEKESLESKQFGGLAPNGRMSGVGGMPGGGGMAGAGGMGGFGGMAGNAPGDSPPMPPPAAAEPTAGEPRFGMMPPGGPGGGGFGGGRPGAPAPGEKPGSGKDMSGRSQGLRRGAQLKADAKGLADPMDKSKLAAKKEMGDLTESKRDRFAKTEELFGQNRNQLGLPQLYRPIEPTKEYAENNYRNLPIQSQNADLVGPSGFWLDYVRHEGKGPFLSKNIAEASRNFSESVFALAVTDLPFESAKHDLKYEGGKLAVVPASPAIAFHEEVRAAEVAQNQSAILVSQNFYRLGERFREENGEKFDKFVNGEFLSQTGYGCQIVVTNPTSSRRRLTLLVQIPVGSIGLSPSLATRSVPLDLEPYRTHTLDYSFYFPVAGKYSQLPVQVSEKGKSVASGQGTSFIVLDKPSKADTASWEHVSQFGSDKEVMDFLGRENLQALNLDKIAFRMRDAAFFGQVTALLSSRHIYHNTLWSYAILHGDPATSAEFLKHNDTIVNDCAGPIQSPLLKVDPVGRFAYEHLEYKPLVNARAHSLGAKRVIVNDRLAAQYSAFLKLLSYQRQAGDNENLALVVYLLMQDRIEEASEVFAKIDPAKIPGKIAYDYAKAWLMLATEQPDKAREIAKVHEKHPVDRWRDSFVRILEQVDEAQGRDTASKPADPENRSDTQDKLAAAEPSFDFSIEGPKLNLSWQNVREVTVNYYLMDVELLFSRNPFVQQSGGEFAFIKPNLTRVVKLDAAKGKSDLGLPPELAKRNLLVEVTAAGKTRSAPYYSSSMDLKLFENQGQLKVSNREGTKPLAKVYVKVYSRLADGTVKFHKDGYTDLRGRFDYATVSTPEKQPITRFSVLVLSEDQGATIRETNPPQR